MLLGTALWTEGSVARRVLVARLASGRVADLNRIEAIRLRKLGEGEADRLAGVLVPTSLRRVLEGGVRALLRVRQVVAYAEKWDRRGTLPEAWAPRAESVELLSCLPQPAALRRMDGQILDRFALKGPGSECPCLPQVSLAAVGMKGGAIAGFCLASQGRDETMLGSWMADEWPTGSLELKVGATRRSAALKEWEGLLLPPLHAGEVLLLPSPKWKAIPDLRSGAEVSITAGFDQLLLRLGPEGVHPTVQ